MSFYYDDEATGWNHLTGASYPFYPIPDELITQPYWIGKAARPKNANPGGDSGTCRSSIATTAILAELFRFLAMERQSMDCRGHLFLRIPGTRPRGGRKAHAPPMPRGWRGALDYEAMGPMKFATAFCVTVRATRNAYAGPVSHRAGSNSQALPMGAGGPQGVRRTRPDTHRAVLFRHERYGLIVADNGCRCTISCGFDSRWNNNVLNPIWFVHCVSSSVGAAGRLVSRYC